MKKPRLVIAGCARNCGIHLDRIFENISRLNAHFPGLGLVVVENDSTDNTAERLTYHGRHLSRRQLIQLPGLSQHIPVRTQRLAFVRNIIIDALREHQFLGTDFVVMIDFDEVCTQAWDMEVVSQVIGFMTANSNLAACFSNCDGHYYDLWAFRHPKVCPGDIWLDASLYRLKTKCSVAEAFEKEVQPRVFQIPQTMDPFEVDSAFGGMGIYAMEALRQTTGLYVGEQFARTETPDGPVVLRYQRCEHVPFHRGIGEKLGARFAIYPALITQDTHPRRFIPEAMDALALGVVPLKLCDEA